MHKIHQTCNYIKLSCETYIDCVLQTHSWETPGARESDREDSVPITLDAANSVMQTPTDPLEDTPEHCAIEQQEVGFSY